MVSSTLVAPEVYDLIIEGAEQGLLISMLMTLANDGATDLLQKLHYHPNHIYLANQVVRALLLLLLGSSYTVALAISVGSYL